MDNFEDIRRVLKTIYGEPKGNAAFDRLIPLIGSFKTKPPRPPRPLFSEDQALFITYGDSLIRPGGDAPLRVLHQFADMYLKSVFSTIHILPFFPYSSDDGFSVTDFFSVDPNLGTWADICGFHDDFTLMFDYVINHVSAQSQWFKDYLAEKKEARDLAIAVDPRVDLSMVTRPRALPLLTEFRKGNTGAVHVWTTFSPDQVDLNYRSLDVLYKMMEVLLFYVQKGAVILRLDAIAYLWKEIGTSCIHLPQTHAFVKLLRKILDHVAPHVRILTETNVPHGENIRYFGNGDDEAHMVYNFTLPPLLLYCLLKQDTRLLTQWSRTLTLDCPANTFINFTASHDGIGVRPLEGIVSKAEIDWLGRQAEKNGGHVSHRQNPDGSQSPYELNISYVSVMAEERDVNRQNQVGKFLASQAVVCCLPGIPATYIHSILGSLNWVEGVSRNKRFRTINREKLNVDQVLGELQDPASFRSRIFFPYLAMMRARKKQPAFHPKAGFKLHEAGSNVFVMERFSNHQTIFSITNFTSSRARADLSKTAGPAVMVDVISGKKLDARKLVLKPYEYLWLCTEKQAEGRL